MAKVAPVGIVLVVAIVLLVSALAGAGRPSASRPDGSAPASSPVRTPSGASGQPSTSAVPGSASPPQGSGVPGSPPAGASESTVSSVSAFGRCDLPGRGTTYTNSEVEPSVAVNPRDPANIVAVWQQDRSSSGGARAIVTATTRDGGATWRRVASPFGDCVLGEPVGGGGFGRVSDPWVSCGPAACFQSALGVGDDGRSGILVSRSSDGGRTWDAAETIVDDKSENGFNDKETVTADPLDGNRVYVVWDRVVSPGQAGTPRNGPDPPDEVRFSMSTDGGTTWAPPRVIARVPGTPLATQVAVLPDGMLLIVFEATRPRTGGSVGSTQQVVRSTDGGATWSAPITIATVRGARTRDPATGNEIRSGNALPEVAVDPRSGRVYVVWADERFSGRARTDIAMSDSGDGGVTWSPPRKVNQTPRPAAAFTPSVAVAPDGAVGVTYYDLRNDTPSRATLPTDAFLVRSSDGGASWQETRLTADSFDLTKAPSAGGYFLGDYTGLATTNGRFVAAYAVATPEASDPTRMIVAIR